MRCEARFVSRRKAVKYCKQHGLKGRVFKQKGRWWEVINPYAKDTIETPVAGKRSGDLRSRWYTVNQAGRSIKLPRKPATKPARAPVTVYHNLETGIVVDPKTGEYKKVSG